MKLNALNCMIRNQVTPQKKQTVAAAHILKHVEIAINKHLDF
jgi:hypothetical protein